MFNNYVQAPTAANLYLYADKSHHTKSTQLTYTPEQNAYEQQNTTVIDPSYTALLPHSYPIEYAPTHLPMESALVYNSKPLTTMISYHENKLPESSAIYNCPSPPNSATAMTSEQHACVSDPCFLRRLLPHPHQEHLRKAVCDIMTTNWWRQNEPEPEGVFGIFIDIIAHQQYQCVFCLMLNSRMDRAIAHCRKHLHHRPFYCNGEKCRNGPGACGSRFFTRECLTAHRKHHIITCTTCATPVEEKNLRRHKKSKRCFSTQFTQPGQGLEPAMSGTDMMDTYSMRS